MSRKLNELKVRYGINTLSANMMNDMDPTANKKYLEWLFKVRFTKLINGKSRINDDFPSTLKFGVRAALTWFERNINGKVPADFRDINKFKTVTEFLTKIAEISTPSRKEVKDSVRVILENERWKVVVPLTHESAKLYGSGTKWCTTQKTYFLNYTRNGSLYYIIDKSLNRKFGFSVNDNPTGNVNFGVNFFNNEDAGLKLGNIKHIYGPNFDVVTEAIKSDFSKYTMDKRKRKALEDAIKRLELTRSELGKTKMHNKKIDDLLTKLADAVNELSVDLT